MAEELELTSITPDPNMISVKPRSGTVSDRYAPSPLSTASRAPPTPRSIIGLDGRQMHVDGGPRITQEIVLSPPKPMDMIVDIFSGAVPGITFFISVIIYITMSSKKKCKKDTNCEDEPETKGFKIAAAILPVLGLFIWYIVKRMYLGRQHKVGVLQYVIYGYGVSLCLIIAASIIYVKSSID